MSSINLSMDEEKQLTSIVLNQELGSSSTSITLGTLDCDKNIYCSDDRLGGVVDLSPQDECSQEVPRLSSSYQTNRYSLSVTDPMTDVEYVPGGNGAVTVAGPTEGANDSNDFIDEIDHDGSLPLAGDDAREHVQTEDIHQDQRSVDDQRQDIFPVDNFRDQDFYIDNSTRSTLSRGDDSSVTHEGFPRQTLSPLMGSDRSVNAADVRSSSEIEAESAPLPLPEQGGEILSLDNMLNAQVTLADESMVSTNINQEEIHQQSELNENAAIDEEIENTIPIAMLVEVEGQDVDSSLRSEEALGVNPLVGIDSFQSEDSNFSESLRPDEYGNIFVNPTLLNALSSEVALARLGDEDSHQGGDHHLENGASSTSLYGNPRNGDYLQGNATIERYGSEGTEIFFFHKGTPFTKRSASLFLAMLLVVTICVAVPLVVKSHNSDGREGLSNYEMTSSGNDTLGGYNEKGNEGDEPTHHPTLQTTPNPSAPFDPVDLRSALTAELLMPILEAGENRYRVRGSPQNQAFEWVKSSAWNLNGTMLLTDWISGSAEAVNVAETIESMYNIDDIPNQTKLVLQQRLTTRYVLALFYFHTGGEEWSNNAGFLSNSHECDWSHRDGNVLLGVECDDGDNVTSISLELNNLSRSLPLEIYGLHGLRTLDLKENSLSGTLPSTLTMLSDLEYLDLSRNDFRGGLMENFGDLSSLRSFRAEKNSFTGTLPKSLGNLVLLKNLKLDSNGFWGSVPEEVSSMKELTHLWLNDNGFTDGMNNFCLEGGPSLAVFYSDCLGRSFPPIVPQVQCSCCTICCAENPKTEPCLLNGGTLP